MESAIDCHFHVIGNPQQFPMFEGRSYTPSQAPFSQWQATMQSLGVTQGVIVQPSFYGADNRLLLQTLSTAKGSLRGIAAACADISDTELDVMVQVGVRGLRFAYLGKGLEQRLSGFVALAQLAQLSPRMRKRGMHVNLLTDSRLLPEIADFLHQTQMPVVIDHMGRSPAALGELHAGIEAMKRHLENGWLWVKLSGIANISDQAPNYEDAKKIHQILITSNPERLLWGSDWPHTKPMKSAPSMPDLFSLFQAWTDTKLQQQILTENPKILYGF